MSRRTKAWDIGFHLGKELGLPPSAKGIVTAAGAGITLGGLVSSDTPLTIVGLLVAFIGITA